MSNEIIYYLIIFGTVILAGVSMIALAFFALKKQKKEV